MNTGKLLALGVLLALSLSVSAGAPHSDPSQRQAMFKEKLALTDAQAEQVQQIMEGSRAERKVIRDNAAGEWEALRKRTREQLSSVLNEEQMSKLESMRKTRFARYRHGHGKHERSDREPE